VDDLLPHLLDGCLDPPGGDVVVGSHASSRG
jgi:hypothetical protein